MNIKFLKVAMGLALTATVMSASAQKNTPRVPFP
jgi:hypothetical protein